MPNLSIRPRMTDSATSIHSSVGSASSLLASSETEPVNREKVNRSSSLRNAFAGSWAALDNPVQPEKVRLTEKPSVDITVSRILTPSTSPSSNSETVGQGAGSSRTLTGRQWLLLMVLMMSTLTSSFAICLFPPFFPKIAEDKGSTASIYGFIIGANCLTSFLVTPFIGKNLKVIGVRFAFVSGVFIGGICCILAGFLEYFPPGISFIVVSIFLRIIHAIGNAGNITATFTYTAVEFPNSVAKIFSLTRTVMNVAQLAGPIIGGALYEVGGFKTPFIIMGCIQTVMAFIALPLLPDYDISQYDERSSKSVSSLSILCVPSIWIPFFTFIVSTMSNGFLSINLEPQVLRKFDLTPLYVGMFFGLKDGANSVASPIWGYFCDRKGISVKFCMVTSTIAGAVALFLLGPFPYVPIDRSLVIVGIALALSGISFSGQQVSGVVDAMREAVHAGYPDNPSTHGMVAGLWSSLSGAGRFVSRSGSGVLVDHIGFQMTAVIIFSIQLVVGMVTFWYSMVRYRRTHEAGNLEPSFKRCRTRSRAASYTFSAVDVGHLTISQPESPADGIICRSVSIPLPRDCAIVRRLRAETYGGFPN